MSDEDKPSRPINRSPRALPLPPVEYVEDDELGRPDQRKPKRDEYGNLKSMPRVMVAHAHTKRRP